MVCGKLGLVVRDQASVVRAHVCVMIDSDRHEYVECTAVPKRSGSRAAILPAGRQGEGIVFRELAGSVGEVQ